MKKYFAPTAETIAFQSADCITSSLNNYATHKDEFDFMSGFFPEE